jgi:hypothetical protein
MPAEVMKCTGCGSADVKELKQGSFVCSYCKTVFSYIHPAGQGVIRNERFCRCGNLAKGLCGTCESGICGVGIEPWRWPDRGGCEAHALERHEIWATLLLLTICCRQL